MKILGGDGIDRRQSKNRYINSRKEEDVRGNDTGDKRNARNPPQSLVKK